MNRGRRTPFPPQAVDWMIDGARKKVLDVGSGQGALAQMIADSGHRLTCVDADHERASRLRGRLPRTGVVVAQAENLPLRTEFFEVVTVQESLTQFAPGLALAEFGRVLRSGGHLAVVFHSRDDTVPWVKRLARRLQEDDPTAMQGDYGKETITALEESPYFTNLERRDFRNWMPITREGMLTMVRRRPALAALEPDRLQALLDDVGALYDSSARAPEPLMLPFQASCWRATVDHTELSMPITSDTLRISMTF